MGVYSAFYILVSYSSFSMRHIQLLQTRLEETDVAQDAGKPARDSL